MKNAISISEILGTIDDGRVEVCATADASYDAATEKISVALNAFARHLAGAGNGQHLPEAWLPASEQVSECLPREEASTFTKDVFRSWIRKVRASVPNEMHLRS